MPKPRPLNTAIAIRLAFALLLLFSHFYSNSQTLNWAFNAGGNSRDESTNIHIDNAGNVLMTGLFSGTVDFDPSAAVFNLTSAGSEDIFVTKYTSTGAFVWAFRIGGIDRDHGLAITTDPNNNVIVTGFFRGSNIDFDPSAATANLTSNGDAGADPGYGGDMFVAKYTPAGTFLWAFNVGGSELYDSGIAIVTDASSNIYVGGYFKGSVDFDPSAGTSILNSSAGTISLSKYSPAGNYQWAFNTGLGDNNNSIFDLKADNAGNIYVAGYFQGANIDFDPSPAVNALSSNGGYEIFFAKYTTSGQYVFAKSIGGGGNDVARGLDIDNNGNIYLLGDFNGTNIDFDPGAGVAPLNSNGSEDVFLAKFTNAGNYVWAFNFGSGASDIGWKVSTDNTHLFITGGFTGTSDMNPSSVVDNLVSNGGNDIFIGKYNLNGEYLCAFNIGGPFDDYGSAIATAGTNIFYLTGYFQGNNVDFDPTAATFPLSSAGGSDIFLSKFTWPDNVPPAGIITGSTVCSGNQAQLTFNATAGTGPFTVVYNNGTSNITVTNVQSGVPFNITPNPTSTTTYTLVSIRDVQRCSETSPANDTALVTVNNCNAVTASFTAPDTVCVGTPVSITNTSSGAATYYWNFCVGNLNNAPQGVNLGNPGGVMDSPVFMDYVTDNNNFYGFVTDHYTGRLLRLDFGNSLLNTPTTVDLGNLGGVLPLYPEGIQVVKNQGQWYAIIVGGTVNGSYLIRVAFGANITNTNPVATNWGNIGSISYPHDLYVFDDNNGNWYGLTVNANTNSITRFNFTNSFSNTPTAVNLGNIGNLNYPTGIQAINDNGTWYAFVTNAGSSTLTRLNFGNSLLNTPTGTNLGNIGGEFNKCWDIYIIKFCGELVGYVINAVFPGSGIVKLNFGSTITNTPTAVDLGNIGNLDFPHCITKIFRVGADLYTFITNVNSKSISRLRFQGCTNSNIPNSTLQNPPPVTYNTPGTYNINLTIDDGLPTQSSFCKQVVVQNCLLPTCNYWPTFGTNNYSSPIPFSNNVSFSFSNPSHLGANVAYNTMSPGNWFSPNPLTPTTSPPNSTAHNPTDIGAIPIFPTVANEQGTITFSSPTTTGFYLHIWQTVSTLDFDHSFTLISTDGDLHVGNSGTLTNNVLIPDVGPLQSPDDANATIYFPPGITQIKFTVTSAPLVQLDGIKFAFTFPDNCFTPDTTIINDYTPVLSLDPCKNIINVGDASAFNIGDTVLVIQMKGAVIDSTNTSSFGTVTNYKNAGNYEFNYVKSKNGNSIELLNKIERQYDLPDGKVQLIRVPYFQNYSAPANNILSCLPWNGSVGGVLVFDIQNTLTLNGNIDVSGKGFRGGVAIRNSLYNCNIDSFYLANNNGINGNSKGEGVYNTLRLTGRGKLANGGGGGNSTNSGGGGGGNGGSGGGGGKQYHGGCNYNLTTIAGVGGSGLNYSNAQNKIFMGGGGGVGHEDDTKLGDGGYGGGIVIISANTITPNGFSIQANGVTPQHLIGINDDGRNGGGGGGTVLLNYTNTIGNLPISVKGGKGEDCIATPAMNLHGPGGGGGGGVVWVNQSSVSANLIVDATGGASGVNVNQANDPWGATAGTNGISLTNLILPITSTLFKPNIDSVRIKDSLKTCTDFDFKGLAYTNSNPVASWQWYFGDGGTANTQNTSHIYAPGNYTVKLVITDMNGCKDSVIKNVVATTLTVNAGNDTTICSGQSITLQGSSNGGIQFQWNNASLLNNNTVLTPIAMPPTGATTTFIITATNAAGCSRSDSVNVLVKAQNTFSINAPSPICPNGTAQLLAQGGDIYLWQSLSGNNATIPNPVVSPATTTTYFVQIRDTVCNQTQNLSTQVVVLSLPNVQAFKQNDIDCIQNTARLNATGAVSYKWTPIINLSNPNISNPIATPITTTSYTVEGTDASGCKNTDTISVKVDFSNKNGMFLVPNAFTPNNDGLNDCFGVKHWGVVESLEFNIYNRWGELVFHTTDITKCWDGKWKGKDQDPAVFVYWIKAKSICGGDVFRKGTVVLIR